MGLSGKDTPEGLGKVLRFRVCANHKRQKASGKDSGKKGNG